MQIMLGGTVLALPDSLRGPLEDFSKKATGNEREEWEAEFKKFLRKELCWPNGESSPIVQPQLEPAPLPMSIIVNCDVNPRVPSGLYLDGEGTEHRKMGEAVTLEKRADGKLYANGKEVIRYRSRKQQGGSYIQGHKLRKELADVQVLNACILDALLANPQLIPEEWKSGYTYFWGTIFRNAGGYLYVRCLYWDGSRWDWSYDWLGNDWYEDNPAACLAS